MRTVFIFLVFLAAPLGALANQSTAATPPVTYHPHPELELPGWDTPKAVGWAIIGLAALAAGANQIHELTHRYRTNPPVEQQVAKSSRENEELVRTLLAQLDPRFEAATDSRRQIYRGQEEIKVKLGAVTARIDGLESTVDKLENRVNNLSEGGRS